MYKALLATRTSPYLTSLHFKIKSLHINNLSSPHITTLHITSLIYTQYPLKFPCLYVTTFLTLFLNVFSLQGKGACKLARNWFQLLMVLFTKEYLTASVLCFLFLIFRLRSSLFREYGFRSLNTYRFPSPSAGVCLEKGAYSGYQSSLCQRFPTRLIYNICNFSRSLLNPN
jgi:hypothetical protein